MGSKETGNRVKKDRQKGGSIKRQARGKGLQKTRKKGCEMKGKGRKKTDMGLYNYSQGAGQKEAKGV